MGGVLRARSGRRESSIFEAMSVAERLVLRCSFMAASSSSRRRLRGHRSILLCSNRQEAVVLGTMCTKDLRAAHAR